jgi:hypothetical protein
MSYEVFDDYTYVDEAKVYDSYMERKRIQRVKDAEETSAKRLQMQQERHKKFIDTVAQIKKKHGDYWVYNDIRIPFEVTQVVALDGINYVSYYIRNDAVNTMITSFHIENPEYTAGSYNFHKIRDFVKIFLSISD